MMKSLGDDVRISSIHGGEEECGLVALSTNNGCGSQPESGGNTIRCVTISIAASKIGTVIDDLIREAVDVASQARKSQFPS